MSTQQRHRWRWVGLMVVTGALTSIPALANPNFGTLTLNGQTTSGMLQGTTGGATSLPAIVSNSDRHNNKCLGFGDPNPDHLLVLQRNVPRLQLRVDSGNNDTTLVIEGPNGIVRCGYNSAGSQDVTIDDTDWQAGSYKVWVGSGEAGGRHNYRLIVRP